MSGRSLESCSVVRATSGVAWKLSNDVTGGVTVDPRGMRHVITVVCLVLLLSLVSWNIVLQMRIAEMSEKFEANCQPPSVQRRKRELGGHKHVNDETDKETDRERQRYTDPLGGKQGPKKGKVRKRRSNYEEEYLRRLVREELDNITSKRIHLRDVIQLTLNLTTWKNETRRIIDNEAKFDSMVIFGPWFQTWKSKHSTRFELNEAKNEIIIKKPGIYFIYGQVNFFSSAVRSKYEILVKRRSGLSKLLARCYVSVGQVESQDPQDNKHPQTCSTFTTERLRENDSLRMRIDAETDVLHAPNARRDNRFGLFRLS